MMTQQDLGERLNLYEALFERNPRDGLVSVAKTYLYILADRPQDALKSALEASLSVSSKSLRVQLAIALGYYLRSKPSEALIENRYALNIDPASPLCHLVQASILLTLRRTAEAKLAFLKCLSLSSDNTFLTDLRLRNRKALCAAQLENPLLAAYSNLKLRAPDISEEDVQLLVGQNPTDPVLKVLLASLQRRSGKIREALALLETGLASYEAFPERLYLLWKTYDDQLGNHQKGETFARRLLEVDPLNDRATGLGYSYLDEETMRHITFIKSLEDLPDSIFARVLPVRDLEALAGTGEEQTEETPAPSPCEAKDAKPPERPFTLPGLPRQPAAPAAELTSTPEASFSEEQPSLPSEPIRSHMASLLEQAQVLARDLRPAPGPMPLSHSSEPPAAVAPEAPPEEPSQPPVAASAPEVVAEPEPLRSAAAEAAPHPSPSSAAQPEPPPTLAPDRVTIRHANTLLAESRFEEALQAFLELSRQR